MALPESFRGRLRLPGMVAPMFLVSGVDLVIESCNAGLVGTLTRNHCRDAEEFTAQLSQVTEALKRVRDAEPTRKIGPLAANVSVGMAADARAIALETCRQFGVDVVVTAGGDPTPVAAAVHDWGGRIFHDVTSVRFAEKAIAAGVDGLIAIGAGGGGHSGMISHLALVPTIRKIFDGTIVMAGAVSTGAAMRAAEILGADLAYLGTRFIASQESMAPQEYKAMVVAAGADDLLYTDAINGVPAMWMVESMRSHGMDPKALPRPVGRNTDHLPPSAKPWKTLWSAGQGSALIHDIPPVAELTERLIAEYRAACAIPPFGV